VEPDLDGLVLGADNTLRADDADLELGSRAVPPSGSATGACRNFGKMITLPASWESLNVGLRT
jgi:hypothetical protein